MARQVAPAYDGRSKEAQGLIRDIRLARKSTAAYEQRAREQTDPRRRAQWQRYAEAQRQKLRDLQRRQAALGAVEASDVEYRIADEAQERKGENS